MATWITHLRIAEKVFEKVDGLAETEFTVGNMAPDSGVPNADWSVFTPGRDVSHYFYQGPDGVKNIHIDAFDAKYLNDDVVKTYNIEQLSFYLGYHTHLFSDICWARAVDFQLREKFGENYISDKNTCLSKLRYDWYDLDFLYLSDKGIFRGFEVYLKAEGFENTFLDFFSPDAFDNRRQFITSHYLAGKEGVCREYDYVTQDEMDAFVVETAEKAAKWILEKIKLPSLKK